MSPTTWYWKTQYIKKDIEALEMIKVQIHHLHNT